MSGVRRASCDCCGETLCGINSASPSTWCTLLSNSSCPDTYAVSISIPERVKHIRCGSGCQTYGTYPSFSGTITVEKDIIDSGGNPDNDSCSMSSDAYEGDTDGTPIDGSVQFTDCADSTTSFSSRTLRVWLERASGTPVGVPSAGCSTITLGCGRGTSGEKCCGVVVSVVEDFSGLSSSWYWSNRFYHKTITDCTTQCPCFSVYGGTADEQTSSIYNEEPMTDLDECGNCEDAWSGIPDCPNPVYNGSLSSSSCTSSTGVGGTGYGSAYFMEINSIT